MSRIMPRTYKLYPLGLIFFLVHIKLLFLFLKKGKRKEKHEHQQKLVPQVFIHVVPHGDI